jgi:pantothenate kinase
MFPDAELDPFNTLLKRLARGEPLSEEQRNALVSDDAFRTTVETLTAIGWEDASDFGAQIEAFRRTRVLCPRCLLEVDGRIVQAEVSAEGLWRFLLPICRLLKACINEIPERRIIVGVAGPPGSGKSMLSALLQRMLAALEQDAEQVTAVVGMDGFHYANEYLDSHWQTAPGRTKQPLREIKGAPETFDAQAFVEALDRLRTETEVSLPRYDRRIHDPLPGGIKVTERDRLVFVEGNYLLLNEGVWEGVSARLDIAIFISMPLEGIRPHIIERHVRGGRSMQEAEEHFERVDKRNYELCMATMDRADIIIVRGNDQRLRAVRLPRRVKSIT